jgi:hypothetical protein
MKEALEYSPEILANQLKDLLFNDVIESASTVTDQSQWRAMGMQVQSVSGESRSDSMVISAWFIPVLSPTLKPFVLFTSVSLSYDMVSTVDPRFEAYRIMNEVSGRRVVNVEMEPAEPPLDRFGPLVTVTVDADAKEALEMYVRAAQEVYGKGFILDVAWTRKTDVSTKEFIRYVARAHSRMGIPPVILDDDQ